MKFREDALSLFRDPGGASPVGVFINYSQMAGKTACRAAKLSEITK